MLRTFVDLPAAQVKCEVNLILLSTPTPFFFRQAQYVRSAWWVRTHSAVYAWQHLCFDIRIYIPYTLRVAQLLSPAVACSVGDTFID